MSHADLREGIRFRNHRHALAMATGNRQPGVCPPIPGGKREGFLLWVFRFLSSNYAGLTSPPPLKSHHPVHSLSAGPSALAEKGGPHAPSA